VQAMLLMAMSVVVWWSQCSAAVSSIPVLRCHADIVSFSRWRQRTDSSKIYTKYTQITYDKCCTTL